MAALPAPEPGPAVTPTLPSPGTAPESMVPPLAGASTSDLSAPSLPSPVLPAPAPVTSAPVLPAPSLPTSAAPAPVAPAPTPGFAPVADSFGPAAEPVHAHMSAAEMFAEPEPEPEEQEPSPELRPLIATRWLRIGVIVAQIVATVAAIGLADAGPIVSGLASAPLIVALLAWSWCAVENVGRTRPATRHQAPPNPMSAAMSWLLAPALAVPGLIAVGRVDEWVDAGTFEQEGTRSMVFAGAVIVFISVMLWAIFRPYSVLCRASRWVSGDGDKFRRWFFGPFIVLAIGLVALVLSSLAMAAGESDGEPALGGLIVVGAAFSAVMFLPWAAWLILGSRAMIDMEEATGHQHRRRTGENAGAVMPMNPLMAAQSAATAEMQAE